MWTSFVRRGREAVFEALGDLAPKLSVSRVSAHWLEQTMASS
jgi:hypothetical protein